uniref:Mercuric ion reductase n=1 Tax=uncultured Nocardioidaceae bacterium TaxID=253824 RepID=A0A6J4LR25_9ACTN|nr:MAG: Mercuric ion reductase [uncultured Nocardioidaceae bacterium]
MTPAGTDMTWDLLVIGGGTAGIVAARTASSLGATVVLVEEARTGGDCLWTGCVPSKALLAAAHRAHSARDSGRFGIRVDGVGIDFPAVMAHVQQAIATIEPDDSPATLAAAGVTVVHGRATLTSDGAVEVDGRVVQTRQVVLATGSSPSVPDIPGLRDANPLTSDSIWELDTLPERLTVMGGGSIGCELGQAFARLGSRVTVVEQLPRVLAEETSAASDVVSQALRDDGVQLRTGRAVVQVSGDARSGSVELDDGSRVEHDCLLVAVGRTPRTFDLGLEDAGVALDERGHVVVDRALRTSVDTIWAAGDLTGHPQFTHVAGVHGSVAASNAVLGLRRSAETATVPRVTYTDPEVASVGASTDDDAARENGLTVVAHENADNDRAVTEGRTDGFARLALDRRGRIVGACVVGPRAGEALAELCLAQRNGMRTRDLAGAMHAYPTYADGPWNAAIADVRERLSATPARQVTALLVTVRRSWLDRRPAQRSSR